jgi:hypothetical protein
MGEEETSGKKMVDNQLMGLYNMAQFNQSLTMGNVSTLQLS